MVGLNYRSSTIVGEYREPIRRALGHPIAEVPAWLDFGHGPSPGDRAPDGEIHTAGAVEPSRLFEQIRGFTHFLLLFTGLQNSDAQLSELEKAISQIQKNYSDFVRCLVVASVGEIASSNQLEQLILLDKDGSLHHKYGAAHSCLYLIRPDGYVGFRSQPVELNELQKYFEKAYSFSTALASTTTD